MDTVGASLVQVEGNNIYNVGKHQAGVDTQNGINLNNRTKFVVSSSVVTDTQTTKTTLYAVALESTTGDGTVNNNYLKGAKFRSVNNTSAEGDIDILNNHTQ